MRQVFGATSLLRRRMFPWWLSMLQPASPAPPNQAQHVRRDASACRRSRGPGGTEPGICQQFVRQHCALQQRAGRSVLRRGLPVAQGGVQRWRRHGSRQPAHLGRRGQRVVEGLRLLLTGLGLRLRLNESHNHKGHLRSRGLAYSPGHVLAEDGVQRLLTLPCQLDGHWDSFGTAY